MEEFKKREELDKICRGLYASANCIFAKDAEFNDDTPTTEIIKFIESESDLRLQDIRKALQIACQLSEKDVDNADKYIDKVLIARKVIIEAIQLIESRIKHRAMKDVMSAVGSAVMPKEDVPDKDHLN